MPAHTCHPRCHDGTASLPTHDMDGAAYECACSERCDACVEEHGHFVEAMHLALDYDEDPNEGTALLLISHYFEHASLFGTSRASLEGDWRIVAARLATLILTT